MKKVIYLLLLVILPGLSAQAQTVYKDQVRVENQSITRSDDNRLTIAMDIIMQANMKISSNRSATLTPGSQRSHKGTFSGCNLRTPPCACQRTWQYSSQRRFRYSTSQTQNRATGQLPRTASLRSLDAKGQSCNGCRPLRLPQYR